MWKGSRGLVSEGLECSNIQRLASAYDGHRVHKSRRGKNRPRVRCIYAFLKPVNLRRSFEVGRSVLSTTQPAASAFMALGQIAMKTGVLLSCTPGLVLILQQPKT